MPLFDTPHSPHPAFVTTVALLFYVSIIWAFFDARRRGRSGILAAVVVALLAWPISLLAWLLFRPTDQVEKPSDKTKSASQLVFGLAISLGAVFVVGLTYFLISYFA